MAAGRPERPAPPCQRIHRPRQPVEGVQPGLVFRRRGLPLFQPRQFAGQVQLQPGGPRLVRQPGRHGPHQFRALFDPPGAQQQAGLDDFAFQPLGRVGGRGDAAAGQPQGHRIVGHRPQRLRHDPETLRAGLGQQIRVLRQGLEALQRRRLFAPGHLQLRDLQRCPLAPDLAGIVGFHLHQQRPRLVRAVRGGQVQRQVQPGGRGGRMRRMPGGEFPTRFLGFLPEALRRQNPHQQAQGARRGILVGKLFPEHLEFRGPFRRPVQIEQCLGAGHRKIGGQRGRAHLFPAGVQDRERGRGLLLGKQHPGQPQRPFGLPALVRRAGHQFLQAPLRQAVQAILVGRAGRRQQAARLLDRQLRRRQLLRFVRLLGAGQDGAAQRQPRQ